MIKIVLSIVLTLLSFTFFAQETEIQKMETNGNEINVSLNNAVNDKGVMVFQLFDEEGFLETPLNEIVTEIVDGKTKVTFKNIKKGTYSIVCFHDSNENGRIDFAQNRMPLEDIGVSNSVIRFGPPSFKESKFDITEDDFTLEIKF